MKNFIGCGTCRNHPDNKNRNPEKCGPCLERWMASNGKMMPNWEDALPCVMNEKVKE